jgi:hypothetical protein
MAKRKKTRRAISFTDPVNEYLDTLAEKRDASKAADDAIRESKAFKKFQKEKKKNELRSN